MSISLEEMKSIEAIGADRQRLIRELLPPTSTYQRVAPAAAFVAANPGYAR